MVKNDIDLQYPHQGQGHSRVIIHTSYDGQKSPIFVKIGLPVPEKKIFFTKYGRDGDLALIGQAV